jgi:hypothetical protein
MGPAVVQEQEIQAIRKGLREQIAADLDLVRMQRGQCSEEPAAGRRLYGAIDVEPREDVLHMPHRLPATRGQAPVANRQ